MLLDSQAHNLGDAMAAFAPPAAGQYTSQAVYVMALAHRAQVLDAALAQCAALGGLGRQISVNAHWPSVAGAQLTLAHHAPLSKVGSVFGRRQHHCRSDWPV